MYLRERQKTKKKQGPGQQDPAKSRWVRHDDFTGKNKGAQCSHRQAATGNDDDDSDPSQRYCNTHTDAWTV
jgi:hypothetical protein